MPNLQAAQLTDLVAPRRPRHGQQRGRGARRRRASGRRQPLRPRQPRRRHAARLCPPAAGRPAGAQPDACELVADHGGVLVFDARRGFGQAMAKEAMRQGIERAREQGSVTVALRNSAHIGRIGHWAEQCAAAGMVSVHFVNVADHSPLQAPYGCSDARLGTNPFAAAVPGPAPSRRCCSTWRPAPSPSARPGSPATRACRCPRAC